MLEITNLTKKIIDETALQIIAEDFLSLKKIKKAEVSLVFITDYRFKNLNKKYREQDKVSDVLSFSNCDFKYEEDNFLGEIFINIQEVARVSKYEEMLEELGLQLLDFSNKVYLEKYLLNFIFVHGLLHLLGFNDVLEDDRKQMINLGNTFLNNFYKKRKIKLTKLS